MNGKILIVDDDTQLRTMLRRTLEKEGYRVEEGRDGLEGLQVFRQAPADLIITDLVMPRKEGIEFIRELLREFPETKIIALSGGGVGGAETYLKLAEKLGARFALQKPVERKILLEAVASCLPEGPPPGEAANSGIG
jgi:DNA-binding response OmpR family regulator